MSREARKNYSSGFFHIMIQGINKEYILNKNEEKEKYMYIMNKYYSDYKIKMIAYCLMDNHAHFIIYTEDIEEISKYMHKINLIYAMDYNKRNNRVGYVFRNRYESQYIYDRNYLYKCIKYVHMNPVNARMVEKEEQYIYSSYNDFKNKKGYIDDNVIELVFKSKRNYLLLFDNFDDNDVEMMDIDNNDENLEIAVNNYLKINNIKIDEIIKSKIKLYNFTKTLVEKGYKKKQIANKLKINPKVIYKLKIKK